MQFFVDSGELGAIQEALAYGYVRGVTTNPTLLRRAGVRADRVSSLVRSAIECGAQEVHVQTYAADVRSMLQQAESFVALDDQRVVVKLPATAAGYAAATELTRRGIRVTLTAVYTLRQALVAQSVGASYIAVYLGRMQDEGLDALAVVEGMQTLLRAQGAGLQILAASIRDIAIVEKLAALGVGAATLAPAVLAQMLDSPATARAATTFGEDAQMLFEE